MKKTRILFIDRDGTIVKEPADEQVDSFEKLDFVEDAISSLRFIHEHTDFMFVMVSNQDGLGTDSFPTETFLPVHNFIIKTLAAANVVFEAQHIAEAIQYRSVRVGNRG